MECLFKTATKNTYEEYRRFFWVLFIQSKAIIRYIVYELLMVVLGFVLKNLFLLTCVVVYPFVFIVIIMLQNRHLKKVFESNKVLQNAVVNHEFYDTYFIETTESGTSQLEYSKLHKIIETKTNFYLMLSKNQGIILTKANFPNGLDDFLRKMSSEI